MHAAANDSFGGGAAQSPASVLQTRRVIVRVARPTARLRGTQLAVHQHYTPTGTSPSALFNAGITSLANSSMLCNQLALSSQS